MPKGSPRDSKRSPEITKKLAKTVPEPRFRKVTEKVRKLTPWNLENLIIVQEGDDFHYFHRPPKVTPKSSKWVPKWSQN